MIQKSEFLEAKLYFQKFLIQQGISDKIIWLFREDIIPQKNDVLVRMSLLSENEKLVNDCYGIGFKKGLGICFNAFALLNSHPCCYIQLPTDRIDAEHMMMRNGLKCSIDNDLFRAKAVNNSFSWAVYKFTHRMLAETVYYPPNMPNKSHCV